MPNWPNWCNNILTITGKKVDIDNFLDKNITKPTKEYKNEYLNLEVLAPIGEWEYEKAVNNWGTKWTPTIYNMYRSSNEEVILDFDSAWAPPINWLKVAMDKCPDLRFELKYVEQGVGFCGIYSEIKDKEYDYNDPEYNKFIQDFYASESEIEENEGNIEENN